MTFGEVLARVNFKIWGNSTVPSGTTTVLTGDEGIIANVHRKIQQDYNYWFMHETVSLNMVVGTQAYTLPDDYKEVIENGVLFKTTSQSYFQDPMTKINRSEAQALFWPINNATAEYPTHFEITEDSMVVYPSPSATASELHFCYWKFLGRPTTSFTDTTSTETDDLLKFGADAVVNAASAEMLDILDEFGKADRYRQQLQGDLELLKHESKRRMDTFQLIDYVRA
jgi:hypothetical protein